MKTRLAASLLALGLVTGQTHARDVSTVWTTIADSAPRSVFDQIRDSAPRSVFEQIQDSAPRSSFDQISGMAN